ncbi:MAG TPA: sensor histidine kinase, partial [Saprospiraceae bacterium]|nr:sensor histidine kinase [Saprospiraceae bacterium]
AQIAILEKDKKLKEALLAKFKQTQVIIYTSFLLLGIVSIYTLARYKKQKNRKAREELNQERLRISRELHDEVGSTLSGIAMYSHLVNQQISNDDIAKAQQSLSIIQQSAKTMITKLSDIIWLINPEQESLEILFQRVREYGRQMTQVKNMKLEFDIPSHLSKLTLSMEARRHIFLFCKESINNAVKYSGGTTLKVAASIVGNQLKFSVSDDGIGFDELKIRKGNGLKNLEHRATSIGGKFHIDSAPDKGSTVNLQYNLTQ